MKQNENNLYYTLFNMVNDIALYHEFITEDGGGFFVDVNDKACEALGYTREEFRAMTPMDLIDSQGTKDVPQERADLDSIGELRFEKEFIKKDGSRLPVELHARVFLQDGKKMVLSTATDISERKRSENSLRENEAKYRYAIDATNDGLWDWNIENKTMFFSPKWAEILGFRPHEVKPDYDFWDSRIHPDDRPATLAAINNLLEGNISFYRVEHRLETKSGEWLWVLGRGKVVKRSEDGTPLRAMGTMTDISYRKVLQLEIDEKQKLLDSILDTVPAAVGIMTGGIFEWVNGYIEELTGYSKEELCGESSSVLYENVSEFKRTSELMEKQIHRTGHASVSTKCKRKNGDVIDLLLISTLLEMKGKSARTVTCAVNISDLKLAQEKLLRSEADFRNIFENTKDAIFWADAETGILINCNRAGESLLEKDRSEIIGSPHTMLHPEDKLDHFMKMFQEHVDEHGTVEAEAEVVTKSGKIIPVHISSNITKIGDRLINQGIFRDISVRRKTEEMERRLAQQEKMAMIGKVAGKMAHDFNNILSITLGCSELMLMKELPPEIQRDVKAIYDSSERGRTITQNLLQFAKDQEPKFGRIDINAVIETAVADLRPEMKGIKLNIEYGEGLQAVTADKGQLGDSITNLLRNSLHALAGAAAPEITIRIKKENQRIIIDVADNGCGIPKEHHAKIFDPAFSLKGSMDNIGAYPKRVKGNGYGLANAKRFVENHGGLIGFTSAHGQGCAFRIELPEIDAELKVRDVMRLKSDRKTGGKKILIVEDELHFGNILYQVLKSFNHKVDIASTGSYALEHLANNTYDAVSLDFVLPDMNGMDIYRKIRERDKDIPVIFVSGNFEFMQSMIDLKKMDSRVDHLAKPFMSVEYADIIHKWL